MRVAGIALGAWVAALAVLGAASPVVPECESHPTGAQLCLYRSLAPSAGLVSSCRGAADCRVGSYYGDPANASWFPPPPGLSTLSKPEVFWLTAALAQVRVDCGAPCSWSYFFEVRRRRLSDPRAGVLAADPQRLLVAVADGRVLSVLQIFSGRPVARIERDWAPTPWLGDAIPKLSFDPDGRLSFTWLRGPERVPVSERVSVPSIPRP